MGWRTSGRKYGNVKFTNEDGTWDSLREYARYQELRLLERAGAITELERQVPYELLPTYRAMGQPTERAIRYVADFRYRENGQLIVEDTKGYTMDHTWRLKRRLFLWRYSEIELRVTV